MGLDHSGGGKGYGVGQPNRLVVAEQPDLGRGTAECVGFAVEFVEHVCVVERNDGS